MSEALLDGGAVAEVASLARQAGAEAQAVEDPAQLHTFILSDGQRTETLDFEKHLATPRRSLGTVKVIDVPSFAAYYDAAERGVATRVYADRKRGTVTAVFNDDAAVAGWRDHRLILELQKTDSWDRWTKLDGQLVGQQPFAEHLRVCALDIVTPDSSYMHELALNFEASSSGAFESSHVEADGSRRLVYKHNVTAKAGKAGNLDIPPSFLLGLMPWEGGAKRYEVTALLRYRIQEETLKLGYQLEQVDEILKQAFVDVIGAVQDATKATILYGFPAEPRRPASERS